MTITWTKHLDNHIILQCIVFIIWGCAVAPPVLYQPLAAFHSNQIQIQSHKLATL